MNRQFYEFWGNVFLNVARGQHQLEEMAALMKKGFAGVGDLTALFRRCYGLQEKTTETDNAQDALHWQSAINEFQQATTQFAAQWGWVTQSEHQQALEKCATLEKKVQQQETTISQLRDLLVQEGQGHTALFQHLKSSLKEQNDQFHALMESIRSNLDDPS